jgi:hypothetical protein
MAQARRASSDEWHRITFRRVLTLAGVALTVVLAASCEDRASYIDYADCDRVERRCRTVCDYWCDAWGCYPMCWDQCWDDCYRYPDSPPRTGEPPAPVDASAPPSTSDGGTPSGDGGTGMLCKPCVSNADCAGALCILRGGPRADASATEAGSAPANAFCGQSCASESDCPNGFACASLGSTRQCLPRSGTCE